MSNPFGEPEDYEGEDGNGSSSEILEGFLCPICREDLKSLEILTEHFEKSHSEEPDALKSLFKDIFIKAKNKIKINFDDAFDLSRNLDKNASISTKNQSHPIRSNRNVFNFIDNQKVGVITSHFDYFRSVQKPRLERYASETNKLIIRLDKLLGNMPTDALMRKKHEQNIVTWLDGKSVKLCPNCAKSFHIARRQHHCRLCGSIMCQDCSKFLDISSAMKLANVSQQYTEGAALCNDTNTNAQQNSIRCCDHCLWLLEARQEMHESRTCHPPIMDIYEKIQILTKKITPDIEMYVKIINSLYAGESIFTLDDASALRGKIGGVAENIDALSKRILELPGTQETRETNLKRAIRLRCLQLIQERVLSMLPLPKEDEIRKIQERKRMEAEQRIATERRIAMETFEKYGISSTATVLSSPTTHHQTASSAVYVHGSDVHSLDNWSACQTNASSIPVTDDPLIEQINIIKGYIKQARQDMNFDVVETLELNLRELQKEFYDRQKSAPENNTITTDNTTENSR